MYSIVVSILGAFCLLITKAYGMKCPPGEITNALQQILDSCPRYFEDATKSYCCMDEETKSTYCCDKEEYDIYEELKPIRPSIIALAVVVPVLILILILTSVGFCWWYKIRPARLHNKVLDT